MGRVGPKTVYRYRLEFKRAVVKLSQLEGVEVQQTGSEEHQVAVFYGKIDEATRACASLGWGIQSC